MGVDVNQKLQDGSTALTLSAREGHKDVVELLLTKGADVNAKLEDGSTALTFATKNKHKNIVMLLSSKGKK